VIQSLNPRRRFNTSPLLLQLKGILFIKGVTITARNLSIGRLTDRVVDTTGRVLKV
jgi:hypothetical protein